MNSPFDMPMSPEWRARTKIIVSLVVFVLLLAVLYRVSDIFPIVIVSLVLAYLLYPVATVIDHRILRLFGAREKRGWAILLSILLFLLVITIVILVVVPALVQQIEEFGRGIPARLSSFEYALEAILSEPILFNNEPLLFEGEPFIPLDRIEEATGIRDIGQFIQLENLDLADASRAFLGSVESLTGTAFSFLGTAFTTVINASFLLMMTFYLAKDGGKFVEHAIQLTPTDYRGDARRIFYELAQVWNAYLRGQLILSLIMGLSVYLAALAVGLPNPEILGLLAGLLEFIPTIGPLIALIPAAFLALISQSATLPFLSGVPFMIVVIVIWTGLQNIEAIFLVPRVMGDALNLHPFVVLIAVLAGAAIAGALGVILAAPFVASSRVILQYVYGKLAGIPPFPERGHDETGTQVGGFLRQWALVERIAAALQWTRQR